MKDKLNMNVVSWYYFHTGLLCNSTFTQELFFIILIQVRYISTNCLRTERSNQESWAHGVLNEKLLPFDLEMGWYDLLISA